MDVVALGELLVDFTSAGISGQGNQIYEANPGGAPCNVLAMLQKLGRNTAFIGKVGKDSFGEMLVSVVKEQGISAEGICYDEKIPTTLAFVHNAADGERTFSFYRIHGLYSLAVILFDFLMIGGLIDAAQWEQFRNIKLCGQIGNILTQALQSGF